MPKQLKFDIEARAALLSGIDKLTDAVQKTMGPQGRTVMIQTNQMVPTVTKDGVTVAKSIFLEDPYENMGAQMAKDVASKTADSAGDGTTTATVLARAIASANLQNAIAGSNPIDLKTGSDKAVDLIVAELENMKEDIKGKDDIKKIATISGNNDSDIGELIADAMEKVGDDGILTIENSPTTETYLDFVEGMEYARGYMSPHFVNVEEKALVEYNDVNILLFDGTITTAKELVGVLDTTAKSGKPLLIIAENIEVEPLNMLILNKLKGGLKVCAIKAPGFGEAIAPILEDIAIQTGGYVVSPSMGHKLDDVRDEKIFGTAKRLIVTSDNTTIVEGGGSDEKILERSEYVKALIGNTESKFEAERVKDRLAKLTGGVGIIKVGGQTEAERQERKDRVDDALSATRAAVLEGILPGGGTALLRAAQTVKKQEVTFATDDEEKGFNTILKAIAAPLKQIAYNAGLTPEVILTKVEDLEGSFGYNAKTHKYEDLVVAGVIDPYKVTKSALKNASSIANMILITDCLIVEKPVTK
jgi:chaperonin GroEL